MKKLNELSLTTTSDTYRFESKEAVSVYEQWDEAITNDWQYAFLKLENRTIILNVNHIVELYCIYVEVGE